ncbi:hypothetical protein F511_33933 [Dorcoceras hygrometricum]|uniref:Uncharacterized protein n=1 Tax=Dorcoceras hygrometricum TaxID=472368 RepID=A0A2Z7CJ42_9LAMI|nr:hypothetical protein F511_33933 [Dorcoceras hygrometricum]
MKPGGVPGDGPCATQEPSNSGTSDDKDKLTTASFKGVGTMDEEKGLILSSRGGKLRLPSIQGNPEAPGFGSSGTPATEVDSTCSISWLAGKLLRRP